MADASQTSEKPDWIYPGAEVILYADDANKRNDPTFHDAVVGKLAKFSFTVTFAGNTDIQEERIYFGQLSSKDRGSSWHTWRYRVIEKTSVEARRLRELTARSSSRDTARRTARAWLEHHDTDDQDNLDIIRAAIVALTEHADLVLEQDTAYPVHRADRPDGLTRCGKPASEHQFYVRNVDNGITCADCKEHQAKQ